MRPPIIKSAITGHLCGLVFARIIPLDLEAQLTYLQIEAWKQLSQLENAVAASDISFEMPSMDCRRPNAAAALRDSRFANACPQLPPFWRLRSIAMPMCGIFVYALLEPQNERFVFVNAAKQSQAQLSSNNRTIWQGISPTLKL